MKKRKAKKDHKQAVNLTLSPDVIQKGEALQKMLCRPSLSNVVEFLVEEAHQKQGQPA